MNITATVYRGTREIGGTLIELNNGKCGKAIGIAIISKNLKNG